jgi:dihydropteroate synthase
VFGDGIMTTQASLGGVIIGDGLPVAVMGALNVSPESFYSGSVVVGRDRLLKAGEAMVAAGAALLDVGAMSTAPYLPTAISASEETDRLGVAIESLASALGVVVSADTSREGPARAALGAGARVINDVTGLTGDAGLPALVAGSGAGLIVMASDRGGHRGESPIDAVRGLLAETLALAAQAGIDAGRVAVDPGIGFFRHRGVPSHEWDCSVLASLRALAALGRPICVGVSRKSFIGTLAGVSDLAERLPGSLAAASAAVLLGAHLVRCHDVAETVQAVRVAEALRAVRQ